MAHYVELRDEKGGIEIFEHFDAPGVKPTKVKKIVGGTSSKYISLAANAMKYMLENGYSQTKVGNSLFFQGA